MPRDFSRVTSAEMSSLEAEGLIRASRHDFDAEILTVDEFADRLKVCQAHLGSAIKELETFSRETSQMVLPV